MGNPLSRSIFDDETARPTQSGWVQSLSTSTSSINMTWLEEDGSIGVATKQSSDAPGLENLVQAMGRGTLIATETGTKAVEDLSPGDWIAQDGAQPRRVLWIGSMYLEPKETTDWPLTRIMAHSIDPNHPFPDLLLGRSARVFRKGPQFPTFEGSAGVLVSAAKAYSSEQAFPIKPVAPVEMFHVLLDGHAIIKANGLPVESFHPGPITQFGYDAKSLMRFMQCFPCFQRYQEFGSLAAPRQIEAF